MPLRDRVPDEAKDRIRNILTNIRDSAVELEDASRELEGLLSIFLEGIASRVVNLIDIALNEL